MVHQSGDAALVSRIRKIRESKQLTLQQVAERARTSHQQIQRLEKGERKLTVEWLQRLADALDTTVSDLLGSSGDVTVPIIGWVGNGEVVTFDESGELGSTEAPTSDEGVVALVVRGDSMWPKYEDGAVLLFELTDQVAADCFGRTCVVQTVEGQTFVKRVQPGSEDGRYRLVSLRAPELQDVELVWASRVTWAKEPTP